MNKTSTQTAPLGLIRQAVNRNCGGFNKATEAELLHYWNTLSEKVRELYLGSVSDNDNDNTGELDDASCTRQNADN